jgi:hypothetical protein
MKLLTAIAACALLLAASCGKESQQPQPFVPRMSYTVSFYSGDSLHVSATLAANRAGGLEKILFPPFDADNPRLPFLGNNVHNIKVTGATVEDPLAEGAWAGDSAQEMVVRTPASSFTIDYDVTFPYGPNSYMKTVLPGASGGADWYYQGNYLFCVPDFAENKPGLWRSGIDAHVSINLPAGRQAHGILSGEFDAFTAYELFFVQFAVCSRVSSCGEGNNEVAVISSHDGEGAFVSTLCSDLVKVDSMCAGVFPAIQKPRAVILQDSGSGMEGLFSFFMFNWSNNWYQNAFRYVVPHEALHGWVGIRTGDLADPWWKEATASYLGLVLSGSLGLSTDTIRQHLVLDLSGNPGVRSHALSDPWVRDHLFYPDTLRNGIVLVYTKGAQVNMILDKTLRSATGNSATLFSRTGSLCTRFEHGAFSREEFKECLQEGTNIDLSEFFSQYVDGVGVLDTGLLARTFAWLDSAGAFSGKP